MLQKLEVGKPYQEGKISYREGLKFDFRQDGAGLYITFDTPTTKEIDSIRNGDIEISVYPKDELLFLLFKFGSLPWMDAPYSAHLSEPFTFEELTEGKGYSLFIVLIDAKTGIVKVIRQIGLSTKFSTQFQKLVEKQKEMPFDKQEYDRKINEVFANYSTEDLVKRTILGYRHKANR